MAREEDESRRDRADREAGRQLAVLAIGAGLLWIGLTGWALWDVDAGWAWAPIALGSIPLLLGVVAAIVPVVAIRVVMGRWAELAGDRDPDSPLRAMQEGVPLEAAVAEHAVASTKQRARIGVAATVLGAAGLLLSCAVGELGTNEAHALAAELSAGIAFTGLVVWYRTL